MNGNANKNANNLTPQNVVDWQNKLKITTGTSYDLLWDGNTTGTKTLLHPITDYKFFVTMFKDDSGEWATSFVIARQVVEEVRTTGNFVLNTNNNNRDAYKYQVFHFFSNTQMTVSLGNSGYNYLFGIK